MSVVAERTAEFTTEQNLIDSGTGTIGLEFLGIANFPGGFANGNTFGVPDEADSALHAIQGVINGASTLAAVDGTTGTPTNGGTANQREPHIRFRCFRRRFTRQRHRGRHLAFRI